MPWSILAAHANRPSVELECGLDSCKTGLWDSQRRYTSVTRDGLARSERSGAAILLPVQPFDALHYPS